MPPTDIDTIKENILSLKMKGMSDADITKYVAAEGYSPLDLRHGGKVNTSDGASYKARAIVGLYDDPDKRLQAIRQLYPDAKPEGEDNFVFTDPNTGQKTLYNPKGLDLGDALSVGREVVQAGTSTLGALAGAGGGTVAAPGPGTVVGGMAGAAAGGYIGGAAVDKLADMITGIQRTPGEVAKTGATDFLLNGLGEGVGAGITKLIGPQMGRLTGIGGDQLMAIAERVGIPMPTRGTVFQNKPLQTLEQWLTNTIGGAGIMENASQKSLNAMRQGVDGAAGTLGQVHPDAEALGSAALQYAENSSDRLARLAKQKFDAVYGGVETAPVQGMDETQRYLQNIYDAISDPAEKARFMADPSVQRALNLATSPNLDVQTLKSVLTDMKQKSFLPGSAIDTPTASQSQINGLLAAMGKDRDGVLTALGRGQELSDANRWYSQEKTLRKALEGILGKKHTPVDLDLLLNGQAGTGISYDAARVGEKLLDPKLPNNIQEYLRAAFGADYGSIAATRLARMGDATAGAQGATGEALFSPSTFLTNWNKSLRSGGEAVTPGGWDDFLKISGALKDAEKMANTSGTGRVGETGRAVQGIAAGAAGLAGYQHDGVSGGVQEGLTVAALPAALAALLANPKAATRPTTMKMLARVPGLMTRLGLEPVGDKMRK